MIEITAEHRLVSDGDRAPWLPGPPLVSGTMYEVRYTRVNRADTDTDEAGEHHMSTEAIIEATSADVTYRGHTVSLYRHDESSTPHEHQYRWTFSINVPTLNRSTPINNTSFKRPSFANRDEAATAAIDYLRDLDVYLKAVAVAEHKLLEALSAFIPDLADPKVQR